MSDPRRSHCFFLLIAGFVATEEISFLPPLYAQSSNVINLIHADSLVGREINGQRAEELIGNVKFSQGKTFVTCRRAIRYLSKNELLLEGEVEVLDSTMRMVGARGLYHGNERVAEAFERVMVEDGNMTLKADYGKYFVNEKKAYFKDHVFVEDSGSVLTAREVHYDRGEQHLTASGNVVITNGSEGMTIAGNHFENFRRRKYSRMTEHPKVMDVDTTAEGSLDTLIVTAAALESYQDSLARLVATDSVVMTRNNLAAESGLSVFYTRLDSIILRKSPIIWYVSERNEDNQVSGDSMFLKLEKRRLQKITVRGSARAISRSDSLFPTRYNQMTGQEITMQFADQKARQIDVDKTATSLYYLFDGDRGNGANKTSGDHVAITFRDGRVDKLKVIGGVEGQYYPERLVRNHENEFNLPGFNWKERRK